MMKWVVILKDSSVLWSGRLNCFCLIWWMLVMLCAVATSRDIAVREERKEFGKFMNSIINIIKKLGNQPQGGTK